METLERADEQEVGSNEPTLDRRHPRWSRTHTTWLLMALSLLPGVVAALFREEWTALPTGVRWAAYVASAILISAACSLILMSGGKRSDS
jgi:hypothetical protein